MTTTTTQNDTAPKAKLELVQGGNALRSLFTAVEDQMNATFAERDREARGLVVALLAREHILLLGPAGTAKSAMANVLCTAITGGHFFEWLLTRFSTPEELFGPVSLDGLKNDRFRRVTAGKLPEATIAFTDEIYKANSAVLNALLTALNERKFDNDGGRGAIPLQTMVGASNELPEGPELAALHDRFLLRYWTQYTKTPDAFRRLLVGSEPAITARITVAELAAAQAACDALPMPDATVEELFKLRAEIAPLGISASDRRWRKAVRILRAVSWLDGSTEVTPESFPILAHVLWETVDQIQKLQQMVAKYTSAELAEATEVHDAMMELVGNLPPKGADDYAAKVSSITRELKRGLERITGFEKNCQGQQSKEKIAGLKKALDGKYKTMRKDAAEALGL